MSKLSPIKCQVCGKEFERKTRKARMCSEKCRNIFYSSSYKESQTEAFMRAREIVKKHNGIGI